MLLKLLSYLLYRYDGCFSPNCYAFRKNTGAKKALSRFVRCEAIRSLYGYKADIKTISTASHPAACSPCCGKCSATTGCTPCLWTCWATTVRCTRLPSARAKGRHGRNADLSLLANLYLRDLDRYFSRTTCSTPVIPMISSSSVPKKRCQIHRETIRCFLEEAGLQINPQKKPSSRPTSHGTFWAFSLPTGAVDLSPVAKRKSRLKSNARQPSCAAGNSRRTPTTNESSAR